MVSGAPRRCVRPHMRRPRDVSTPERVIVSRSWSVRARTHRLKEPGNQCASETWALTALPSVLKIVPGTLSLSGQQTRRQTCGSCWTESWKDPVNASRTVASQSPTWQFNCYCVRSQSPVSGAVPKCCCRFWLAWTQHTCCYLIKEDQSLSCLGLHHLEIPSKLA